MRLMSFSLTTAAFENRSKTVTRRLGWKFLKPGDVVMGVEKGMGLKKGEKVKRLHKIEIVSNDAEPLSAMYDRPLDVNKEGFPKTSTTRFIEFFCAHNRCQPDTVVNRIEFKHL